MWSKSIFASKTFWVNALVFVVTLITWLADQQFVTRNPQLVQYCVLAITTLNVWLRYLTNQPVHVVGRKLGGGSAECGIRSAE